MPRAHVLLIPRAKVILKVRLSRPYSRHNRMRLLRQLRSTVDHNGPTRGLYLAIVERYVMRHTAMFKPRRDKTGMRAGVYPAVRHVQRATSNDDAIAPKVKVSGGFVQTNYAYIEKHKLRPYVGRR